MATQDHDLHFQDPFFLEKTIISSEQDWDQEYFELHEFGSKDSYIFKVRRYNILLNIIIVNFYFLYNSLKCADSKMKSLIKIFVKP